MKNWPYFLTRQLAFFFTVVFPLLLNGQPGQVQANGITIAYESFGSKDRETILLISGTNAQLTMWPEKFCKKLAENGFRVIRFDNRDIGLSTKFDKLGMPDWPAITRAIKEKKEVPLPYSLDDMATDAVGLLDALGIKKAHIAGASMGGMIAQRVAYNYPEHVLSLASIMAGGGNATFPLVAKPDIINKIPQPGLPDDTAAYIKREMQSMTILAGPVYPYEQEKLLEYIRTNVNRSFYPDGFFRQGAAALAGFYAGRQDKLKTIKVPTVVIHGSEDPLVVLDAGKDVAANIPGAKFELIKGMGHDFPDPLIDTLADIIVKNAKAKIKVHSARIIKNDLRELKGAVVLNSCNGRDKFAQPVLDRPAILLINFLVTKVPVAYTAEPAFRRHPRKSQDEPWKFAQQCFA